MWFVVAFAILVPYGAELGLVMTGSRARRIALVAAGALMLAMPFLYRHWPLVYRAALAFGAAMIFIRLVDLAGDSRPITAARRLMHATMLVEMRRTPRVPRVLHVSSLVRLLGLGALTVAAFTVIARVPDTGLASRVVRYFAAAVASYTAFDGVCAFVMLQWRALGFQLPSMHHDPIMSRSVGEFWGERWNRMVGSWLRAHCFMPLARRRRARLGLVAAFLASTLLHVYLAWAVLDGRAAMMWAIFFGMQIPIVFAERALRVTRWPRLAGRVWTIGILGAASPFFVEPVLRAFEILR